MEIKIKAPAKINLSLDVLERRSDGYHNVEMIMQTISLFDILTIKSNNSGKITLSTNKLDLSTDNNNTAYKAAQIFKNEYNTNFGYHIVLEKNIPLSAGLAGGSTDAAAVLIGLNKLNNNVFSQKELMEMGKTIGADVPFCILRGTAKATGIGDVLTPISPLENIAVLVVNPGFDVSTPWVYKNLVLNEKTIHPNTEKIIKYIEEKNINLLCQNMGNVLESVTVKAHPQISQIKNKLLNLGATGVMMSGSGPSVFGIFDNTKKIKSAYEHFKSIYNNTFLVTTIINV